MRGGGAALALPFFPQLTEAQVTHVGEELASAVAAARTAAAR